MGAHPGHGLSIKTSNAEIPDFYNTIFIISVNVSRDARFCYNHDMENEGLSFEQFFSAKIKERGITLKKLADVTGIAPSHIESLLRGDFDTMPSAPYFRGYLMKLGDALGFDGEEWWKKLVKEGAIKKYSGSGDTLPRNRFMKAQAPKWLWLVFIGILVVIYLGFEASHILGKPTLTVAFPDANPYITSSSTVTLSGTVANADTLYLNGSQNIPINPDGSWQETVLLGAGSNPFEVTAKKFLGGTTQLTETIVYQPPAGTASTTATGTAPTAGSSGTTGIPNGTASGTTPGSVTPSSATTSHP
jgi:cytoskeletal protein RodZ